MLKARPKKRSPDNICSLNSTLDQEVWSQENWGANVCCYPVKFKILQPLQPLQPPNVFLPDG